VLHAERTTWRTRTWLVLAAAFAVTCHNSHLAALPGVVWLAADRCAATPFVRRLAHAALPVAVGAALGWSINAVADVNPASTESLSHLLTGYFVGASWAFVEQELLRLWFPPLVVFALVCATRARPLAALRAAAPCLATGLPSLALFTTLGIWTSGGYFTTAAVFVSGAALAAAREPARFAANTWHARALAATGAAVLVLFAAPIVRASVTSALRTDGERVADVRYLAAREFLPSGGLLISVEGTTCCINGRDLRWREWSLTEAFVAAVRTGSTPDAVVADLLARSRADFANEALLVDTSYESDEFIRPHVGPAMQALFDGLAPTHTQVRIERSGRTFVHLVPRESP